MIHWIPIQTLEEHFERMFGPTETGAAKSPIYCQIHKRSFPPTHYAVTELYCDYNRNTCSKCNMAYKLTCGHIVVDDCEGNLNLKAFASEAEWKRVVVNKPME